MSLIATAITRAHNAVEPIVTGATDVAGMAGFMAMVAADGVVTSGAPRSIERATRELRWATVNVGEGGARVLVGDSARGHALLGIAERQAGRAAENAAAALSESLAITRQAFTRVY